MNLLKPSDFPQIRGRAKRMVLRIQNGTRLVLSPQAAFELGLRANGKKGAPVLIGEDKKSIKLALAGKDQPDEGFSFKPAATSKNSQHPPFACTNAGLAQHILKVYGIESQTKSVALKMKADKDWWVLQSPA